MPFNVTPIICTTFEGITVKSLSKWPKTVYGGRNHLRSNENIKDGCWRVVAQLRLFPMGRWIAAYTSRSLNDRTKELVAVQAFALCKAGEVMTISEYFHTTLFYTTARWPFNRGLRKLPGLLVLFVSLPTAADSPCIGRARSSAI